MKIKIFQINTDRDVNNVKFAGYDSLEKWQGTTDIDASLYDEVFDGEVEASGLEGIYTIFNTQAVPFHRGQSLSMSDIVTTEDGAFYCDRFGFQKVDFDESLAHKPDNLLKVVYVEPHKSAVIKEIDEEGFARAVEGSYERIYTKDNCFFVCNQNAKFEGMEGNRTYNDGEEIIAGPFVVVGRGENLSFRSLTDEEAERYMKRFAEPEEISQDEVQGNLGIKFLPWQ